MNSGDLQVNNEYHRYIEASHVLHSTNTFYSADRHTIYNLDVLFPSNRLAQIPGLEIFQIFKIPAPSRSDRSIKKEVWVRGLNDLLSKIANSFPSLRSLHLGWKLVPHPQLSSQPGLDIVDSCLDRVDEMICQCIQGVKVEVVIDKTSFFDLRNGSGDFAYCDYLHVGQKLWRRRKDRDTGILLSTRHD